MYGKVGINTLSFVLQPEVVNEEGQANDPILSFVWKVLCAATERNKDDVIKKA